jgi:hypothetical protein
LKKALCSATFEEFGPTHDSFDYTTGPLPSLIPIRVIDHLNPQFFRFDQKNR